MTLFFHSHYSWAGVLSLVQFIIDGNGYILIIDDAFCFIRPLFEYVSIGEGQIISQVRPKKWRPQPTATP